MTAKFEGAPGWFIKTIKSGLEESAPDWFLNILNIDPAQEKEEAEARSEYMTNRESGDFEENLLSYIRKKEAGRAGYDAYFGVYGGNTPAPPKNLTEMTLDEVLNWQNSIRGTVESTAAGGYQIIYKTLQSAKSSLNLKGDEIFNPELQDRIARDYLLRKKRSISIDKYLSGGVSKEEFANDLAKEWASLPVLTETTRNGVTILPGQSYYKGVGSNRALVKNLDEYSAMFDVAEVSTNEEEDIS